jgi:hypothetical protein
LLFILYACLYEHEGAHLSPALTAAQAAALVGTQATPQDHDMLLTEDADVYDQDGNVSLKFRKGAIAPDVLAAAVKAVESYVRAPTPSLRTAFQGASVRTKSMGCYDAYAHCHYSMFKALGAAPPARARTMRFNTVYPDKWARVLPLVRRIDELYATLHPHKHGAQLAACNTTGYRIDGMAFTTLSVNASESSYHVDANNLAGSFGNMVVGATGEYSGCHLVLPTYRVAVDCRPGDFLLMDTQQVHGGTALEAAGDAMRMSFVAYVRAGIIAKTAGSTTEQARAAQREMEDMSARYAQLKKLKRRIPSRQVSE